MSTTGDRAILDEVRPFLEGPLLQPGQEDMYFAPTVSAEQGTLYEHCARALSKGTTQGVHGLPLMGAGDWNDGMNRVGIEGRGESVWVGWFLYATLAGFVPLCEQRGDTAQAAFYRATMLRLKAALNDQGWDGDWYLRAFYDDGTPLGSARNEECQIDAIAQSWGLISGAADAAKADRAMQAVAARLVAPEAQLIRLLTPPFDHSAHNPGYIQGYLPGVRENGGQYTHAAIWTALAYVHLRDGDTAERLFRMLNPLNHARTPQEVARYKVEPYVVAADIYDHPQHVGRGGWTWYTGSASWLYRLGLEFILGLRRQGDYLTVAPCIPAAWPGFRITYRHGRGIYHIVVENHQAAAGVEVDGESVPDGRIPLSAGAGEHHVRVRLAGPVTEAS